MTTPTDVSLRRDRFLCKCLAVCVLLLVSAPVSAQDSHWGVTVNFVPQWKAVPELYDFIWDADGDFTPQGKEFRVGVVRGSDGGGDWSVTFVRNWFSTDHVFDLGSGSFGFTDQFGNVQQVVTDRFISTIIGDVVLTGVKYEKFTPFVTIRDRVQVGLAYGGGIGSLSGTVRDEEFHVDVSFPPPTWNSSSRTVPLREPMPPP